MAGSSHTAEIQVVEFTAQHLWRYIRPAVRRHLSPRCRNCILPSTYAPLDGDGICEHCRRYAAESPAEEKRGPDPRLCEQLDALLRSYEGKGEWAFDAMLLLSGGKDSAFLLHRIVNEYPGLRLLTVLVDNGFMSRVAIENVEHVLSRFDVPHITIKPQPSFVARVFRYTLSNLDKQSGYSIVDLMDGHITFDSAKNFAVRQGIPLILCGLAKVQTELVFGPVELEFPPEQERAALETHAGIVLRDVFDDHDMQFWFDGSLWPPERVPRFVLPLTVWDPDEEEIRREVDRLGLLNTKRSRPTATNNALIPVIGMAEVARFGYCSWEIEFARTIREGKSDRDYWLAIFEMLEYSTRTGRFISKSVEQTLSRLGLTKADIGIAV